MSSSDTLHFRYHLKAEHLQDSLQMERAKRLVKNAIVWFMSVAMIGYGILNLSDPTGSGKAFIYMGLLILTMNLTINYGLLPWLVRRQISRIDRSSTEQALDASVQGLTVYQGKQQQHVPWSSIKRSFQGKHSYLFEMDNRVVIVLPFEAVQASGQQAAFEQLLQDYAPQTA
ncbi:MAG: YcxB family protein [Pseudomonadota bacterium]|nr:YcxB family protein [Pseudomonadota bacterium]